MTEDTWGPWIEHDGKGCPCKGQLVHVVRRSGQESIHVAFTRRITASGHILQGAVSGGPNTWDWGSGGKPHNQVIRYRIRKPKGLTQLQRIAEQPQPVFDDDYVKDLEHACH